MKISIGPHANEMCDHFVNLTSFCASCHGLWRVQRNVNAVNRVFLYVLAAVFSATSSIVYVFFN